MSRLNILYTDKTFLKVNKANPHVETQIVVSWDYEDSSVEGDVDFGNKAENEAYLKRFESGELLNIIIFVKANAEGETGSDCLGMNHVKANDLENEVRRIVAEYDMKNNACIELRESILSTAKRMAKYNESEKVS